MNGEEKGSEVGGWHLLKALGYAGQRGKKEGPCGRDRVEMREGGERGAGAAAGSCQRWQLMCAAEMGC
jgi:hypothetical protein